MAYARTVKTSSGARAVQSVHSSRRGSRDIEHIGSAHDGAEFELLKAVARQRLAAGQGELDLGLGVSADAGGPLQIVATRMGPLWDALSMAYDVLGFDAATEDDQSCRAPGWPRSWRWPGGQVCTTWSASMCESMPRVG